MCRIAKIKLLSKCDNAKNLDFNLDFSACGFYRILQLYLSIWFPGTNKIQIAEHYIGFHKKFLNILLLTYHWWQNTLPKYGSYFWRVRWAPNQVNTIEIQQWQLYDMKTPSAMAPQTIPRSSSLPLVNRKVH